MAQRAGRGRPTRSCGPWPATSGVSSTELIRLRNEERAARGTPVSRRRGWSGPGYTVCTDSDGVYQAAKSLIDRNPPRHPVRTTSVRMLEGEQDSPDAVAGRVRPQPHREGEQRSREHPLPGVRLQRRQHRPRPPDGRAPGRRPSRRPTSATSAAASASATPSSSTSSSAPTRPSSPSPTAAAGPACGRAWWSTTPTSSPPCRTGTTSSSGSRPATGSSSPTTTLDTALDEVEARLRAGRSGATPPG